MQAAIAALHDKAPTASETDWQQILDAVRAHLLERAGDTVAARESYLRAARMTVSAPEQRYLALRAARLRQPGVPGG